MSSFAPFQNPDASVQFADRQEAGGALAVAVLQAISEADLAAEANFGVYALPRGGLPIAAPIAKALHCPLDIIVAKKITRPDNIELAIGAVTADGALVWAASRRSGQVVTQALPRSAALEQARQQAQTHAQQQALRLSPLGERFPPQGRIALIVDDGIATGMTMAAAVAAARSRLAAQVWVCAPVAPRDLIPFLQEISDRVIVLATPTPFYSVSRFYNVFPQVSTAEAAAYLQATYVS